MKKKLIGAILVFTLVAICFAGCLGFSDNDFSKKSALEFSLKVLRAKLDDDREEYISYLASTIYEWEGSSGYSSSSEDHADYIRSNGFHEDFSDHTYEEYLENYAPYVKSYDEYKDEYDGYYRNLEIDSWSPNSDDYIFSGWENTEDGRNIIDDDHLAFMITHQKGKWQIISPY